MDMQRETYAQEAMAALMSTSRPEYAEICDCALRMYDPDTRQCLNYSELEAAFRTVDGTPFVCIPNTVDDVQEALEEIDARLCDGPQHMLWDPDVHIDECPGSANFPVPGDILIYEGTSPGCWNLRYRPEAAIIKGWIQFDGTGVIAIQDSYNVSGIVDNGVGNYTVTWDIDFANNDYSAPAQTDGFVKYITSLAVGSMVVRCFNSAFGAQDHSAICVSAIGDQ